MTLADPTLVRTARVQSATEFRLWAFTLFLALGAVPLLGAMALDARQFQADSVWLKPLKFHLALTVYFATLAFFARWLPATTERAAAWRWFLGYAIAATVGELLWIGGAAALGVASHFNVSSLAWFVLYGVMGVFAVSLTALSLIMGIAIWRDRASALAPALRDGIGFGLVLTFVLTVVTAGTMSASVGHLVGVPLTGARVPLMGWSTEVGDLRLPHFLATHALHVVPLAGFAGSRGVVWAVGAGYTALVVWAFGRALTGLPLLA